MKLTSKQINLLIVSIGIFLPPFLNTYFKKMEISHNVVMPIFFVIIAVLIFLLYLKSKVDVDKKQFYTTLLLVLISILIILLIYFFLIN